MDPLPLYLRITALVGEAERLTEPEHVSQADPLRNDVMMATQGWVRAVDAPIWFGYRDSFSCDDGALQSGRSAEPLSRRTPVAPNGWLVDYSVLATRGGGAVLASRLWWIVAISHRTTMAPMTTARPASLSATSISTPPMSAIKPMREVTVM